MKICLVSAFPPSRRALNEYGFHIAEQLRQHPGNDVRDAEIASHGQRAVWVIPGQHDDREPSLSIPCFAERRYGGVLDDEMLMALPPDYLGKAIAGMEALTKNGLRYPFPQYGIQQDVRAGMAVSYPGRGA